MSRASAVSPDTFSTFGELFKYLRRRAGLTQRELSIAVGYSDAQISRIERNERVPDQATINARFVPALQIAHEPEVVTRLLELATAARQEAAVSPQTRAPALPSQHNLPLQLTNFIGRENEIVEVKRLLSTARLVTLTGAGGTGKTRLALQVAANLLATFPDGIWLVQFAPISNPVIVPQTVATALHVQEEPGRPLLATLVGYLRAKKLLLVLDNCEHLLEACAQLAEYLLRACPHLGILATSREGLGIAGETCFQLPTLSTPAANLPVTAETLERSEAVRLFADRAGLALPGFAVTSKNAPALAQVCRQLDGIPLAIELAAARIKLLSVEQIAARLDDRFRLLVVGSRTALPRHQTLSALIDWSYDLLSDPERALFHRLSVFRGGWTLEAAEEVCEGLGVWSSGASPTPAILDLLSQLVNKSLVVAERQQGEAVRYRMLETIRLYAWQKLLQAGEARPARSRHLEFFLRLAEEAEPRLHGADQTAWLDRLETEHANLRAAWEWSRADEASEAEGLRVADALFWFWYIRNYMSEGRSWLAEALAQGGASERSLARARALYGAGTLSWKQMDYLTARAQLEESISLFREAGPPGRRGLAYALIALGELAQYQNATNNQSPPLFRESVVIFRELGDQWGLALSLHRLGVIGDPTHPDALSLRWSGVSPKTPADLPPVRALYEQSLALFRGLGDKWAQTFPLGSLGNVAFCQGDRAAGRALFEASLAIQREFGDRLGIAWSLWALGNEALDGDDFARAAALYGESLEIYTVIEEPNQGIAALLSNLAELARRQGDFGQAAKRHAEGLVIRRTLGNRERIAYSLDGLGRLAWSQGDYVAARSLQAEALAIRRQSDNPFSLAHSLEAFAMLAAMQTQPERAAKLFGAAEPFQEALCYSVLPIWRAEHERNVAAVRADLGTEAFTAAWAAGRLMSMEQAIAYAQEVEASA